MNKKIVVLDSGHGGFDPGALGKKTKEKDNNLTLVLKIGKILSQYNEIEVKYTRTTDIAFANNVNDDLVNRILVAKKYSPDVFVSCHNNSFNKKAVGIETFCYKFGGTDEKLTRCIHDSMMAVLPFVDRKVKVANHYVTRKFEGTKTSACLVEYGFIDSEEDKILANMDKAAETIAKGILQFLKVPYQNNQPQSQPQGGKYKVKNIVLVSNGVDERAAGYLADFLKCSIAFRGMISSADLDQYESVFEVGGTKSYSRSKHISGSNRFDTCQKVLDFIAGK